MTTSGWAASLFFSRMQTKESDSSVCQELKLQVSFNDDCDEHEDGDGGGAYAGVEANGLRVDSQAAELDQLLELDG